MGICWRDVAKAKDRDKSKDKSKDKAWSEGGGMDEGIRHEAVRMVAQAVSSALRAGLGLDAHTLQALREATGAADTTGATEVIGLALHGRDTSELAPLAALLFSPDADLRQRLEPELARQDLNAAEAEALAGLLAQWAEDGALPVALLLPVTLPPQDQRLTLAPTPEEASALARRLRPEATAPAELREILARRLGKASPLTGRLGVLLRQCRLEWTPERVFFLATLLERAEVGVTDMGMPEGSMSDQADDLPALIAWATRFLDICGSPLRPREQLAARRQALEAQLRQAQFAEQAAEAGSYEVRMSQGLRMGHVHGPEVQAELALLDRACTLVLGVAESDLARLAAQGGPNMRDNDMCDLGSAENAEELLALLAATRDA